MTPSARLEAAIEILTSIISERRPAPDALKGWGQAHRFAGSGDRAAIGGLVYDALRRKASSAYLMGADTPRAVVLGMLKRERGLDGEAIARLASGGQYAPAALSDDERARLDGASLDGAPAHIAGDYPDWLDDAFAQSFGDQRAEEGAALASRAPLDLRVNTLKADREKAAAMLADLKPEVTPWSPWGLRIALAADAKAPPIHAEPAFIKGFVEVQDEGSQLAALFSGAKPGEQALDLCAGAGGKTLALAAMMENKGQLFATDDDKRRLAPIHERLTRSGARNVQVRTPKSVHTEIDDLQGRMDLVLIDAPCTGTGAWRRNPDAKWRMRPGALEQRVKEQADILDRAVGFLKPGGRIVYITCSLLDAENGAQVRGFLARHTDFTAAAPGEGVVPGARRSAEGVLLTPQTTGTDGFFVSVLRHS
ncbi:RsmB/NOP family class I SAM-dependent RNA methyltransferase [Undibacter mobilis]|uniref:RsmB/NOP family class I SAM-dependent RNA methyltransferase n=1 Tax=Undibacter mobilis TaxID=2292256 RepID=A0A371B353_9BRAD|nr:RsmB/NOP family class I SAM-dependent RNA methyltransferase [Undibacter mobilis]RDV01891.1 RsmB/NOP family class I SAM-dependent RNA methyltransferase [Undibacter mobilis]